jgi:hypothetical protein
MNGKQQIESLQITRNPTYVSVNAGRFVAQIKFKSETGNIEVLLAPEIAERLMAYLAPLLAEFSRRATEQIASDIAEQCKLLEAPAAASPTIAV